MNASLSIIMELTCTGIGSMGDVLNFFILEFILLFPLVKCRLTRYGWTSFHTVIHSRCSLIMSQSKERLLVFKPSLSYFPLFIEPSDRSSLAIASSNNPFLLSPKMFMVMTTRELLRRKKKPIRGGIPTKENIVIAKLKDNNGFILK